VPVASSYKDSGADAARDLSPTLRALGAYDANGGGQMAVAFPIDTMNAIRNDDDRPKAGVGVGEDGDPSFTISKGHSHAVAVSLRGRDGGGTAEAMPLKKVHGSSGEGASRNAIHGEVGDPMFTLEASSRHGVAVSEGGGDKPHVLAAVAICEGGHGVTEMETVPTLQGAGGGKPGQGYHAVRQEMAVRRLTPVECERLQGFPDNYTMILWKKKPADQCPDGPRYKALGNSMAVPVMRWIGRRIAEALR
jgi:DNA (cytosine-5)-methyltransferase 1